MGAASSVRLVYKEAVGWFKNYIDTETYLSDFHSLDKDSDGNIGYGDLKKWIENKLNTEGGNWNIFRPNVPVLMIAHKMASESQESNEHHIHRKVIDVSEFRSLLINLFAISILWVHFDHANNWGEGHDIDCKRLDKDQFTMACKTLTASHAHEQLTPEQIDEDFNTLDRNSTGYIGFMEVCQYCSRFLHPMENFDKIIDKVPKFFGTNNGPVIEITQELQTGPKQYYDSANTEEKTNRAVNAIAAKIENELRLATQLEMEFSTVAALKTPIISNVVIDSGKDKDKMVVEENRPEVFEEKSSAPVVVVEDTTINSTTTSTIATTTMATTVVEPSSSSTKTSSSTVRISPVHRASSFANNSSPRASTPRTIDIRGNITSSPRASMSSKVESSLLSLSSSSSSSPKSKLSPQKSVKLAKDFIPSSLVEVTENKME